jgi:hypothetical protein
MTTAAWLEQATADTVRRGMPEARPVLEGLAAAMEILRRADWNTAVAETAGAPARA